MFGDRMNQNGNDPIAVCVTPYGKPYKVNPIIDEVA